MISLAVFSLLALQDTIGAKFSTIQKTGENGLVASAKIPLFEGTSKLVPVANAVLTKVVEGRLGDSLKAAKDADLSTEYTFTSESHVEVLLPTCVSTWFQFNSKAGETFPPVLFDTRNFGFVQGKPVELHLKDLFLKDPAAPVSKMVIGRLGKTAGAEFVKDGTVRNLTDVQLEQFVITRDGLLYLFEPQTMGPVEAGSFKILLKFAELPNLNKTGVLRDVLALPKK